MRIILAKYQPCVLWIWERGPWVWGLGWGRYAGLMDAEGAYLFRHGVLRAADYVLKGVTTQCDAISDGLV